MAPTNVITRLSSKPMMTAAASVPGTLPMPANTTMANDRPIYSRPIKGSTGVHDDQRGAGQCSGHHRDAEGVSLDLRGVERDDSQGFVVMRDCANR